MNEYSRIIIEEYCMTHRSKRRDYIWDLLELSYSMDTEPTDEALKDLDDFLFC